MDIDFHVPEAGDAANSLTMSAVFDLVEEIVRAASSTDDCKLRSGIFGLVAQLKAGHEKEAQRLHEEYGGQMDKLRVTLLDQAVSLNEKILVQDQTVHTLQLKLRTLTETHEDTVRMLQKEHYAAARVYLQKEKDLEVAKATETEGKERALKELCGKKEYRDRLNTELMEIDVRRDKLRDANISLRKADEKKTSQIQRIEDKHREQSKLLESTQKQLEEMKLVQRFLTQRAFPPGADYPPLSWEEMEHTMRVAALSAITDPPSGKSFLSARLKSASNTFAGFATQSPELAAHWNDMSFFDSAQRLIFALLTKTQEDNTVRNVFAQHARYINWELSRKKSLRDVVDTNVFSGCTLH